MRWRLILFVLLALIDSAAPARADDAFVIGVMNDESGPYADLAGPGSVEMARMAIEDFGGKVLGRPIELLVADHQNKVDVGSAIARQWYDEKGVRAIFDITNSGVALAIQGSREGAQPARHLRLRPPRRTSPARPARRTASSGTPTIGRTASR